MTFLILLILLMAGLLSGLPVAFVFLFINIIGLMLVGGMPALSLLAGSAFDSVANFALAPIALFLLLGAILVKSGIAFRAVDAVDDWIGKLPGRLALVAVGGGAIFGALSGSSISAAAFLGSSLAPEMERRGYKPQITVGSILGAAGLDTLIPPSALVVLLGALANLSIGQLLIATIVPGLILGGMYVLYFVGRAVIQPHLAPQYEGEAKPLRARLESLFHLIPLTGLILVITGAIFFGIATPSEAAALGGVAAMLLAVAYRRLSWRVLIDSLWETTLLTAMILMIVVGSKAFGQVLAIGGTTTRFVEFASSLQVAPILVVMCMQVIVLVMACFIDQISIMMLTVPLFFTVITTLGLDPIWFAVVLVVNLQLGAVTPPFGFLLFVMKGAQPHLSTSTIYRAVLPIIAIQILFMGILIGFPSLVSWLPNLMPS